MNSNQHRSLPGRNGDPVSDSTHQLALDIHNGLMSDLGVDETLDEGLEERRKSYPYLLFGELAMHLAGIKLPDRATEPDRARAIVEALRRIFATPRLLEAITKAPYTSEFVAGLVSERTTTLKPEKPIDAVAIDLQQKVAQSGYLERSMVPDKRVVQLEYATTNPIKIGFLRRDRIPPQTVMRLKIVPRTLSWTIRRYKRWNEYDGYIKFIDKRTATFDDAFTLIAIDSDEGVPASLSRLIGKSVGVGKVGTGTQFKMTHNFSRCTEEVPGHEEDMRFSTLRLPATLQQAYLGDTFEYPLFSEFYF